MWTRDLVLPEYQIVALLPNTPQDNDIFCYKACCLLFYVHQEPNPVSGPIQYITLLGHVSFDFHIRGFPNVHRNMTIFEEVSIKFLVFPTEGTRSLTQDFPRFILVANAP